MCECNIVSQSSIEQVMYVYVKVVNETIVVLVLKAPHLYCIVSQSGSYSSSLSIHVTKSTIVYQTSKQTDTLPQLS